jgi:hypothetical protein
MTENNPDLILETAKKKAEEIFQNIKRYDVKNDLGDNEFTKDEIRNYIQLVVGFLKEKVNSINPYTFFD